MDRAELANFLRRRRSRLTPADVGLPVSARRRTPGLRRDEVAGLAGMSTDYYTRMEQARSPHPSTQLLAALARALRLTTDERDYLYRLAGHPAPAEYEANRHLGAGLLHLLSRLDDTPAFVVSDLDEVLVQNAMAVALMGDVSSRAGLERNFTWLIHPEVGVIDIVCETLLTPSAGQRLLVFYPRPGTDAREKLDLLRVIGTQNLSTTPS